MPPSLGSSQGQGQSQSSGAGETNKRRRKNMIDTTDKYGKSKKKKSKKQSLAEADTQLLQPIEDQFNSSAHVDEEINEEFRATDNLMQQWLFDNPAPEPDPPVVEDDIEIIDLDGPTQNINNTTTTFTTPAIPTVNNNNNIAKTSVITHVNNNQPKIPTAAVAAIIKPAIPTIRTIVPTKILPITILAPTRPSTTTVVSKNVCNTITIPTLNNSNNKIVPSTSTNNNNNNNSTQIVSVEVVTTPFNLDNFRLTSYSFLGRYKNSNGSAIITGKPKLSDHFNILTHLAPEETDVDIEIAALMDERNPDIKCNPGISVSISPPLRGQIKVDNIFFVKATDLFYPVLDDPYEAGQVAALLLLNKLFAVGIFQVDKMLMHLTIANDLKAEIRDVVIPKLILGFRDIALTVGARVTGGHSLLNPWVSIGGVATSICTMDEMILSQVVVPGDFLVLTKPLGLGVAVLANEILQAKGEKLDDLLASTKLTEEDLSKMFGKAKKLMLESNKLASQLMHKYNAHGACDIEFGLFPSAQNLASSQQQKSRGVPLKARILNFPCIKHTWEISKKLNLQLDQGLASEVSGGLLIALPKSETQHFLRELNQLQRSKLWQSSVVGVVELNEQFVWTAEIGANARVLPK